MILSVHRQIVRDALADVLAPGALRIVIAANLSSDLHQLTAERHFDNGPNVNALGMLWSRGYNAWMQRAIDLATPQAGSRRKLRNRLGALRSFGFATHALADFYAHTNWVELAAARGEAPTPAPLIGEAWVAERFFDELQSGYFSVRYGWRGCPHCAGAPCPPAPFAYCHEQLNKDAPDRGHGSARPTPVGPTYHEQAVALAVTTTRDAWSALTARLVSRYDAAWIPAALAGRAFSASSSQ